MNTMTERLLPHATDMQEAFLVGTYDAFAPSRPGRNTRAYHNSVWEADRALWGLKGSPKLLTAPADNLKLGHASRLAYGLTLQHHSVKLADGVRVNLCPWAGHCAKVCVLNNGSGAFPAPQLGRNAKTEFLYRHPESFAYLLGYELAVAVGKSANGIDFRPNMDSDVEWERILPNMLDGSIFGDSLWAYGYTKNVRHLDGNGWALSHYRAAFSANEGCRINDVEVRDFLARGGSVAVVTNRQPDWRVRQPVRQWDPEFPVLDATADDSWVWESGVIGDLAAKGKARRLIGKSGFVHMAY
jgi:hypothetical protein